MTNFRMLSVVALASLALTSQARAADLVTADVIFTGGEVLTVDQAFSVAKAIAIKGDRILAVGTEAQMAALKGPATRVIPLNGRTLMPGLIDTHLHALGAGLDMTSVDVGAARSMADFLATIKARVDKSKPGEWVITSGRWFETNLTENRLPTREDLDKVSPNNPVQVQRGHASIFNSYAMKLAGVTANSPVPEGGEIRKGPSGQPNGILMDNATDKYFGALLPSVTRESRREAIKLIQKEMNATGITGVVDPSLQPEEILAYEDVAAAGAMTVRTGMMLRIDPTLPLPEIESKLKDFPLRPKSGDNMLWIHGLKLVEDGGPHNAYMREPYANNPAYIGMPMVPTEKLVQVVDLANDLGWRPGIHVVGDAATDAVLTAYEAANKKRSILGKRWELIHVILPDADHYPRINALQLNVTTQTMHNWSLGANFVNNWGKVRANKTQPTKTWLKELGIRVSGGTDGGTFPLDQMLLIWMELTRQTEGAGVLGADQAITLPEAIRLHTINGAYASFDENLRGSLEPGKLADLIVLSGDIMKAPVDDIRHMKVQMTMVGGKVVYGALPGLAAGQ